MPTGSFDINELKRRMQGATQSLKHELGGLRTGRAAASMLEPVQVEAYGSHMPLSQLASVNAPEARLLTVQVWDQGMVKTIFDKKTGELLGAHLVGAEVTELIQGFVVAMNLETTEEELMHTIFPHPTLSEMMKEAVLDAYGRVLNM